jgi:hypothetical protein
MTNRPACLTAARRLDSILLAAPLILGTLLVGACSSSTSPSTTPAAVFYPPPGEYRATFTVLNGGAGAGGMSITPKEIPEHTYTADISIRLVGVKANTTYLVQRAQEGVGGRPLGADGICQRSLSLFPWSSSDAAAPTFQTVPLPSSTGPLVTVTTAANGDGALDFEFRTAMILAGTTNDVMYRLVDNDAAPTTELRGPCMMITAR